jgi:hypothetical protein
VNLRLLARPTIFLAIAIALLLAADLLWSVGMEIRATALNPACRLLQARVEMGLDCDSQNQFGFFLAIIAPFLGFGALTAFLYGIVCIYKRVRYLFLCPPLAYPSEGGEWPDSGDRRHEFDVIGPSAGDADFRRHQR